MSSADRERSAVPGSEHRPNIVYILTDQHRADALGCAGHPVVETPILDRLASEGVRFSRMWCQSPVCQPSRASIITGRYVHEHGVRTNFEAECDPNWDTMMKSLQRAGYVTANIGKTHYYYKAFLKLMEENPSLDTRELEWFVASFGFDHVLEEFDKYLHAMPGMRSPYTDHLSAQGLLAPYMEQVRRLWRETPTHWDGETSVLDQANDLTCFLADAAIDWLDGHDGRPFFLQLSFVQPHVPLVADPEWAEHYAGVDVPLGPRDDPTAPNEVWDEHLRYLRRHSQSELLTDEYVARGARQYYGMVSLIDQRIGDVLAALERKGWLDDTLIVYSSDHGEMLGDHGLMGKSSFYRSSVEVPAIVRPPRRSARAEGPVVVDDPVEQIDLTATILDAAGARPVEGSHGRSLLSAFEGGHVGRETSFSALGKRGSDALLVAGTDGRWRCTIEWSTGTPCELFDLESDPDELVNLVGDPEAKLIVEQFRERFEWHLDKYSTRRGVHR